MRLIDANELVEDLRCYLYDDDELEYSKTPDKDRGYNNGLKCAIRRIKSYEPTVDAAPVVRCKDCKHWGMLAGPPETEHIKCCEFGQYMVGANGYCVYGEVKDND